MVAVVIFVSLLAAVLVSFWFSLVEATYLTLRPFSLSSEISAGSTRAAKALEIVSEKTRLVSVTTFIDTISNVVLDSLPRSRASLRWPSTDTWWRMPLTAPCPTSLRFNIRTGTAR